jgi:pimeloyl-ACP methyl ester carboxylesterase
LEGIETRFIETPRLKQFVRFPEVKNSSISVVFVHGNFTSGTYFEETILALSQKFYGIAPDLRGYGLT